MAARVVRPPKPPMTSGPLLYAGEVGQQGHSNLLKTCSRVSCPELALAMVRDGEGATKVIEIAVQGAKFMADARKVAYEIGNAALVKTAFFGGDPNWGRILSAAGSVGVKLPIQDVELRFEDVVVFSGGRGVDGQEKVMDHIMKQDHPGDHSTGYGQAFLENVSVRSYRGLCEDQRSLSYVRKSPRII